MARAALVIALSVSLAAHWCCCGLLAACCEQTTSAATAASGQPGPGPACCCADRAGEPSTATAGAPCGDGESGPSPCGCCHRDEFYGLSKTLALPSPPLAALPEPAARPHQASFNAPRVIDAGEWLGHPPRGRPPLHLLFEVHLC